MKYIILLLILSSCATQKPNRKKYGCPGANRTWSLIKQKPDMRVGWVLTFVSGGDTVVRVDRLKRIIGDNYILK